MPTSYTFNVKPEKMLQLQNIVKATNCRFVFVHKYSDYFRIEIEGDSQNMNEFQKNWLRLNKNITEIRKKYSLLFKFKRTLQQLFSY